MPVPARVPLPLRCSWMTAEGNPLLPVLPLDIRIGDDGTRATGRPTAVTAHIDEVPNEDQGRNSELGSRRVVKAVRRGSLGRRVRFMSQPELYHRHRHVGDGVEVAEAAPDEMWVAEGEVGSYY
jgi:hypothetical protein